MREYADEYEGIRENTRMNTQQEYADISYIQICGIRGKYTRIRENTVTAENGVVARVLVARAAPVWVDRTCQGWALVGGLEAPSSAIGGSGLETRDVFQRHGPAGRRDGPVRRRQDDGGALPHEKPRIPTRRRRRGHSLLGSGGRRAPQRHDQGVGTDLEREAGGKERLGAVPGCVRGARAEETG